MSTPLPLIVPGYANSPVGHWQTLWEMCLPGARRVRQTRWLDPDPRSWGDALEQSVATSNAPVLLIAHSLGTLTVVHWAQRPGASLHKVAGALLVAPVAPRQRTTIPGITARFAPLPEHPLPFPTQLVASRNDAYCSYEDARQMARRWQSECVDAGFSGHISRQDGFGPWPLGEQLLAHWNIFLEDALYIQTK